MTRELVIETLEQRLDGMSSNDEELAEYLNDGWQILNITVLLPNPERYAWRFVTLMREEEVQEQTILQEELSDVPF